MSMWNAWCTVFKKMERELIPVDSSEAFFVLDSSQIHYPGLSTQFQFNSLREQILNNSFQLNSPQQWANSNLIQILWQNNWIQLFWILFWGIELELIREFESIRTGLTIREARPYTFHFHHNEQVGIIAFLFHKLIRNNSCCCGSNLGKSRRSLFCLCPGDSCITAKAVRYRSCPLSRSRDRIIPHRPCVPKWAQTCEKILNIWATAATNYIAYNCGI